MNYEVLSLHLGKESHACVINFTDIGKKAWLFAKLKPGRARKRINAN